MAFTENFDSDLGNYTPVGGAAWDGSLGNPSAGCANIPAAFGTPDITNTADSQVVATGNRLWFTYRCVGLGTNPPASHVIFQVGMSFDLSSGLSFSLQAGDADPDDTGWRQDSIIIPGTHDGDTCILVEFINSINVTIYATDLVVYVDSVSFSTDPPPFGQDELRYLGLAADNTRIYASANDSGTLKLIGYNPITLVQVSEVELGAATFAELDARTRGIFPVARPGSDGVLFVRGRDGNNNQVLLSDDGGASFSDVSDAGWATSKYCVGLLPDPLRPDDLVAVFDDNDLYQSEDGATTWSQTGDAPATLRAAARQLNEPEELLLAAQAEDTIYMTNNLGLSFEDVSDVALGTINVVVVSR